MHGIHTEAQLHMLVALVIGGGAELHGGQLHGFAVSAHHKAGLMIFGAGKLVKNIPGYNAPMAIDFYDGIPHLQAALGAERGFIHFADLTAGDHAVRAGKQHKQCQKTQQKIHAGPGQQHRNALLA